MSQPTISIFPSQEILQEVLADYQGTILLVSHDRYLIDALATQIWEIDPAQTFLQIFEGDYSQYRAHQNAEKTASEVHHRETIQPSKIRPAAVPAQDRRRKARLTEVEIFDFDY